MSETGDLDIKKLPAQFKKFAERHKKSISKRTIKPSKSKPVSKGEFEGELNS